METMLEEWTDKEQCSVVHILWENSLGTKDIHKEMFTVGSVCCIKQFTAG
jgi:hypothetical protein